MESLGTEVLVAAPSVAAPVAVAVVADVEPAPSILGTAGGDIAAPDVAVFDPASFAVEQRPAGSAAVDRTASRVDLVGTQLRASGDVDLGRFERLSDYVNLLDGFCQVHDVTLLSRTGEPTRVHLPDLRVRLDDVTIVGQRETRVSGSSADRRVVKQPQRLTLITSAHLVSGTAYLHSEASLESFVDATDPPFLPLTNVRVRWLSDRRLAGRYGFALVQRTHIVGVAIGAG